jgi:type II secretory pathway component PulF
MNISWEGFEEWIVRYQFGGGTRIEFYETLSLMLENNVLLSDALHELYMVWSDKGRKPSEGLALIAKKCHTEVANGKTLGQALEKWVPSQEVSLINAGERSGGLVQAFADAIRIIQAGQRIKSAILSATVYPAVLMSITGLLLWIIATKMVPKMALMSNPDNWPGAAYALHIISDIVTDYGLAIVISIIVLLSLISYSLPRLTGSIRIFLDRTPIYSTYRMLHGSTFLLNIAVMLRANVLLKDALQLISDNANPWMKERVMAAHYGISIGGNLGVALDRAGHRFPDKKAVQILMVLAARKGFEEALNRYSERWLEQSIKNVEKTASLCLVISISIIAMLMGLVVTGTTQMQQSIEQEVSSQKI